MRTRGLDGFFCSIDSVSVENYFPEAPHQPEFIGRRKWSVNTGVFVFGDFKIIIPYFTFNHSHLNYLQ